MKSGKIIKGRLAKIFVSRNLAKKIKKESEPSDNAQVVDEKPEVKEVKKPGRKPAKKP